MFDVYIFHLFSHKSAVMHLRVLKRYFIKRTSLLAACMQETKKEQKYSVCQILQGSKSLYSTCGE